MEGLLLLAAIWGGWKLLHIYKRHKAGPTILFCKATVTRNLFELRKQLLELEGPHDLDIDLVLFDVLAAIKNLRHCKDDIDIICISISSVVASLHAASSKKPENLTYKDIMASFTEQCKMPFSMLLQIRGKAVGSDDWARAMAVMQHIQSIPDDEFTSGLKREQHKQQMETL